MSNPVIQIFNSLAGGADSAGGAISSALGIIKSYWPYIGLALLVLWYFMSRKKKKSNSYQEVSVHLEAQKWDATEELDGLRDLPWFTGRSFDSVRGDGSFLSIDDEDLIMVFSELGDIQIIASRDDLKLEAQKLLQAQIESGEIVAQTLGVGTKCSYGMLPVIINGGLLAAYLAS